MPPRLSPCSSVDAVDAAVGREGVGTKVAGIARVGIAVGARDAVAGVGVGSSAVRGWDGDAGAALVGTGIGVGVRAGAGMDWDGGLGGTGDWACASGGAALSELSEQAGSDTASSTHRESVRSVIGATVGYFKQCSQYRIVWKDKLLGARSLV